MSDSTEVAQHKEQAVRQALVALTPECLSAALLVNKGDLTRAENMLVAQAHTRAAVSVKIKVSGQGFTQGVRLNHVFK